MVAQLDQYLPVLLLLGVAVAVSGGMLGLSHLLGQAGRRSAVKDTAYECGMVPVAGGTRWSVKFYLVAMLFILFDIELVFLYPWAVVFRELRGEPGTGGVIYWAMISFLGVLFAGYLYAWRKGALDWRESARPVPAPPPAPAPPAAAPAP